MAIEIRAFVVDLILVVDMVVLILVEMTPQIIDMNVTLMGVVAEVEDEEEENHMVEDLVEVEYMKEKEDPLVMKKVKITKKDTKVVVVVGGERRGRDEWYEEEDDYFRGGDRGYSRSQSHSSFGESSGGRGGFRGSDRGRFERSSRGGFDRNSDRGFERSSDRGGFSRGRAGGDRGRPSRGGGDRGGYSRSIERHGSGRFSDGDRNPSRDSGGNRDWYGATERVSRDDRQISDRYSSSRYQEDMDSGYRGRGGSRGGRGGISRGRGRGRGSFGGNRSFGEDY